jgi:hypothetical protein
MDADLRNNLRYFVRFEARMLRACHREGPQLVGELTTKFGSLRATAKACDLSPTYLSMVQRKKSSLSPETFLRLVEILEGKAAS